jgi:hypothetical protein
MQSQGKGLRCLLSEATTKRLPFRSGGAIPGGAISGSVYIQTASKGKSQMERFS